MKTHVESAGSNTPPTLPAGVDLSNRFPTDGNPATGTPPSVPGAFLFYSMAAEIENAIAALGKTPDVSNVNQLGQAIIDAINGAVSTNADTVDGKHSADIVNDAVDAVGRRVISQALGANGWRKFSDGTAEAWGYIDVGNIPGGVSTYGVNFPVGLFVSEVYRPVLTIRDMNERMTMMFEIGARFDTTGFDINLYDTASSVQDGKVYWQVEGH